MQYDDYEGVLVKEKNRVLARALAVIGVTLAWIPLVAPVVPSLIRWVATRVFRLDYLMPAELFPVALAGGGLLMWAAIRARSRQALIGWGLGGMVGALAGSQISAIATGLASGATEPSGWRLTLVAALLALYVLALFVIAVSGILLVRDLSPARADVDTSASRS